MAFDFLTPGEVDIIDTAKSKKKLKKEKQELAISKKELKPDTIGIVKGVKKVLFTKQKVGTKPKKVFTGKPVQEDLTKEQNILRGMFGHGSRVIYNGEGRNLPKIHNTLNSGGGILKSGDNDRETAGIFGF